MNTMIERKCAMCGAVFTEDTPATRKYCLSCSALRKKELRKGQEERRRQRYRIAQMQKADLPKPPPKTLQEKDKRYCARCVYRGRYSAGYLCNYIFMTGERRGCKPGVGCDKKMLVSQYNAEMKSRCCERCGKKLIGSKYARFCDECRLDIKREMARHMIEVREQKEKGCDANEPKTTNA